VTWRQLTFHDIIIQRAQPPNGYVHAVILDRTATNEDYTGSVLPPHNRHQVRGGSDESVALDETPPGAEALYHGLEPLSSLSATGLEGHQEDSIALQPSPELADDTQTQPQYEDDVLQNLSGQIAQISISHDRGYATAVCLAAQGPLEGDVGGELAARNL
jgi:hypothetical protein